MKEENGRKRVCVLGAGASGLAALKAALEEGLHALCYEKAHDIGGLWRFNPQITANEASVMRCTVINTSKELMAFSDFPPPAHLPNYMHNADVLAYLRLYAQHNGLAECIRFRHTVVSIERSSDFRSTGRWLVTVQDEEGSVTSSLFDGVLVASGHHVDRHLPQLPGLEHFRGRLLHSQEYKEPGPFLGQRVAILGIGNSAVDIAVDVSRAATQTFVCTRRGAWIQWKAGPGGLPIDVGKTRCSALLKSLFPAYYARKAQEAVLSRLDLDLYGLRPSCGIAEVHPTESDELPSRLLSGAIQIRHSIVGCDASGRLLLADGGSVDVDALVMCTGYSFSFPFVEEGRLILVADNQTSLYKYMFPPGLPRGSLAVIGLVQPLGSTIPVAEMQSRLAVQVIAGKVKLPSQTVMERDIEAKREAMAKRYVDSRRHTLQVDYVSYLDELAKLVGARPSVLGTALRDPRLGWALWAWPFAAYQYRLRGPHRWDGARGAILGFVCFDLLFNEAFRVGSVKKYRFS